MQYLPHQIAEILSIPNLAVKNNHLITNICYDTRNISFANQSIFIALITEKNNGHKYIQSAYDAGIRNFIISQPLSVPYSDANFFIVNNTLDALQTLATAHRKKLYLPIIAITGSNGKTIVKEWLFHLLKNDFVIYRSPRSFNSQLGVALSILGIEKEHTLAIIEAGISQKNEMVKLEKIIQPSLVLLTNIGSAHDAGFLNHTEKCIEKLQLAQNADILIYPSNSHFILEAIPKLENKLLKKVSWGKNEHAKIIVSSIEKKLNKSIVHFKIRSVEFSFSIPFVDDASIENACSCVAVLMELERLDEIHLALFNTLPGIENRLECSEGKNNNYLINDSYSNDFESLKVAFDFMQRQQPNMSRTLILSDFEDTNKNIQHLASQLQQLISDKEINKLLLVGNQLIDYFKSEKIKTFSFETTQQLLSNIEQLQLKNECILIKGARVFELEKVYQILQKKSHNTRLEINLEAIKYNYNYFKKIVGPTVKIMPMVKAFGYGSGTFEAAKLLQFMGAEFLSVAYADEGVALRNAGITCPILVLNVPKENLIICAENNLQPAVFSFNEITEMAKLNQHEFFIHIEIDSGMHRLGFNLNEIKNNSWKLPSNVTVIGIFSHLSASEDEKHDDFTNKQIELFNTCALEIEQKLGYKTIKHICNTGGILRFPNAHLDMVRLGIGLYGIDPTEKNKIDLMTVTSLKTYISQIKEIDANESVGYARKAISNKKRKIAIIPIGYADGLWRSNGNENGAVFINNAYSKIIGNVCMDMTMVDITNIECNENDEVEIFGNNISIYDFAARNNTIPYEVLTSISERVKRVYVGEN